VVVPTAPASSNEASIFGDTGRVRPITTTATRSTSRRSAYGLTSRIRRASPFADAVPGNEKTSWTDPDSLAAELSVRTAGSAIPEPRVGETVRLPDIVVEPGEPSLETDAVGGAITYNGTTAQSGPEPTNDFGDTQPGRYVLTNVAVTKGESAWDVRATLQHDVTFQVRNEVGPTDARQKDISTATDPRITGKNYAAIAADLTPNRKDLGGRPPRLVYWSRALTIVHEQFHADDTVRLSRNGTESAQKWLGQQQADSAAAVEKLLEQAVATVKATRDEGMKMPGREERAYGDGIPLYEKLVSEIKAKFERGKGGSRANFAKFDPSQQGTATSNKRDLRKSQ
jgi:hypothetical protein